MREGKNLEGRKLRGEEIEIISGEIVFLDYKALEKIEAYPIYTERHEKARKIINKICEDLEKTGLELQSPDFFNPKSLGRNFIRVENISNAIELLVEDEPIYLNGEHENCIESHGIEGEKFRRVSEEGRSKINQSKIILSFNESPDLKIKGITEKQLAKGGNMIDRSSVKIAEGEINDKNLNYAVIQFPVYLFPEERLTEKEKNGVYENYLEVQEEFNELKEELNNDKSLSEEEKKDRILNFNIDNQDKFYNPISRYIEI